MSLPDPATDGTGDDLMTRLVVAAAHPGRWPGREPFAQAVDALRAQLARLARSRSAAARRAGAELTVRAIATLGDVERAARRAEPTRQRVAPATDLRRKATTRRAPSAVSPAMAAAEAGDLAGLLAQLVATGEAQVRADGLAASRDGKAR